MSQEATHLVGIVWDLRQLLNSKFQSDGKYEVYLNPHFYRILTRLYRTQFLLSAFLSKYLKHFNIPSSSLRPPIPTCRLHLHHFTSELFWEIGGNLIQTIQKNYIILSVEKSNWVKTDLYAEVDLLIDSYCFNALMMHLTQLVGVWLLQAMLNLQKKNISCIKQKQKLGKWIRCLGMIVG